MDVLEQLQRLDPGTLAPIVSRALGSDSAELLSWHSRLHEHAARAGNITTGGVYRVSGQAIDRGVTCSWSLIVKLLISPAGMVVPGGHMISEQMAEDPSRFSYWRREANAFASGRLDELAGSVVAPRCFGITEGPTALPGQPVRPGQQIWLWLEDLGNSTTPATPDTDYARLGRHLGLFNGSSIGYVPGAADQWMSRGWLRSWLETAIAGYVPVLENDDLWAHPQVRRAFPEPVQQRLLRLWNERETLLDALEQMPRAFCHLDAYPGNLFLRSGGEQTVAIDWSFAGMAAPGEELSPLVVGAALVGLADVAAIEQAEQQALDGYIAGLRSAGWGGDPRSVELAFRASAALRYGFFGPEPVLRSLLEPDYQAQTVRRWGRPWEHIVEQRAELTYLLLHYAEQALETLVAS